MHAWIICKGYHKVPKLSKSCCTIGEELDLFRRENVMWFRLVLLVTKLGMAFERGEQILSPVYLLDLVLCSLLSVRKSNWCVVDVHTFQELGFHGVSHARRSAIASGSEMHTQPYLHRHDQVSSTQARASEGGDVASSFEDFCSIDWMPKEFFMKFRQHVEGFQLGVNFEVSFELFFLTATMCWWFLDIFSVFLMFKCFWVFYGLCWFVS